MEPRELAGLPDRALPLGDTPPIVDFLNITRSRDRDLPRSSRRMRRVGCVLPVTTITLAETLVVRSAARPPSSSNAGGGARPLRTGFGLRPAGQCGYLLEIFRIS
jgi:hypothetical protein